MRGFLRFVARKHGRSDIRTGRCPPQIHLGHPFAVQVRVGQVFHRDAVEIRVAEVRGTVGIDAPFGLHHRPHGAVGLESPFGQRILLHGLQQGQQRHASARWRRHGNDRMVFVRSHDRLPPNSLIISQILVGNDAVSACHLRPDAVGRLAFVEAVTTVFGDPFQRFGKFGLCENISRLPFFLPDDGRAVRIELPETRLVFVERGGLFFGDGKALFGHCYRRSEQICPGQRAVFFVRLVHPGHRTGNACGKMPVKAEVGDRIAFFVQIHVPESLFGGFFPKIQCRRFASGGTIDHKSAAANVPGVRIDDRERELHGNGGIDGVAAPAEDVHTDFRSQRVRRHDRPVGKFPAGFGIWGSRRATGEQQEENGQKLFHCR